MNNIVEIIRKKPFLFLLISLAYVIIVGLLKWRLRPPVDSLWFLGGGFLGVYFLDIAELFFNLTPSPFRSVIFLGLFSVVSFFVVTSAGSLIASGLVLSLYLCLILWQAGELKVAGNLNSWYQMVAVPVTAQIQRSIFWGFVALFFIETFFFVR